MRGDLFVPPTRTPPASLNLHTCESPDQSELTDADHDHDQLPLHVIWGAIEVSSSNSNTSATEQLLDGNREVGRKKKIKNKRLFDPTTQEGFHIQMRSTPSESSQTVSEDYFQQARYRGEHHWQAYPSESALRHPTYGLFGEEHNLRGPPSSESDLDSQQDYGTALNYQQEYGQEHHWRSLEAEPDLFHQAFLSRRSSASERDLGHQAVNGQQRLRGRGEIAPDRTLQLEYDADLHEQALEWRHTSYSSTMPLEQPPTQPAHRIDADDISAEDLEELRKKVPLDENGQLTSLGSINHNAGCKPCLFLFAKIGCQTGILCEFCHFYHKRRNRIRACKGKRERFRKLKDRIERSCQESELQEDSG